MRLIGGKPLNNFLLILMSITHRYFSTSDLICADDSISWWYAQGGHWINLGLPMYVEIYRDPENGAEIQNYACGRSGIMMRLRIVNSAKNE